MRKILFVAAALTVPRLAAAQGVFGLGSDATVPAPGIARVTVAASVVGFDRRFARNGDGDLEPVGADLSTDNLGLAQFPALAATQARIRTLAGDPAFALTLGRLETTVTGRVERLPISLEVGVVPRVSVFATVPIVRTRSAVSLGAPIGAGATAGVNPAKLGGLAFQRDTALVNAFTRASSDLRARLAQCAGSTSSDCNAINSDRAGAEALATSAESFRTGLRQVYVEANAVPTITSTAHTAIANRISAFKTQFQSYGVTSLAPAPAAPVAATPLSASDLDVFLSDSAYGIAALPLRTTERTGIGDVEIGARAVVLDALSRSARHVGLRVAVGALMRLATGKSDVPSSFVDIGLGDGQADIEASAVADAALTRRFTVSVAARYVRQLEDDERIRVPIFAGEPFPAASREMNLHRDLGDIVETEITPRFNLNDFFALGAQYVIRRKQADSYEGLNLPDIVREDGEPSIAALTEGTQVTEHRLGFGVSFSNMTAYQRRRARFPYELSYLHYETTRASGGTAPKTRADVVQMRIYFGLFR